MPQNKPTDRKCQALQEQGTLYAQAAKVTDPLFLEGDFFDARDLVQVKYEMLRRVRRDGQSVSQACGAFGFSRPSFYNAQTAVEEQGLPGLVPKRRGPRGAHKLTAEVVAFLRAARAEDRSLRASELAARVQQRFGVTLHPRTIERSLARPEKRG